MSDLISRQDAIEYFMTNTNWHDEDGYQIHDAEDKRALLKSYFDGIPSAQPERKTGKWISQKGGSYKCSECGGYALNEIDGNYILVAARTPYCPFCGKKMEEWDE